MKIENINGHIFVKPRREILIELWTKPTIETLVHKSYYAGWYTYNKLHRLNNLPSSINDNCMIYAENGFEYKILIRNKRYLIYVLNQCKNNRFISKHIWILPE